MFLFSSFILRPLLANRLRSVLTMLGVSLGVAVMLAIQLANQGSLRGFSAALDAVSGKAALEISSPPIGIDESLLPALSWLREVGISTPVIEADVTAKTAKGSETLRIIGIDALRDPALRDYALSGAASASVSGMDLMTFLARPDSLLVTHSFAQRHGLKAQDQLTLWVGDRERVVTITQILGGEVSQGKPQSALAAQSLGIMDIANAQIILDRPGRVDRVEVRLHEGQEVHAAEQKVRQRLPAGLTVQRPQRRSAAVEKMLAAFHFNLTMLSGIALVVGLFLIYNTISVAVMTRRREIGMLRTLGVTRGTILRLFLGEAVLLALCGALLGVPLAKGLAEGAILLTSTTVDTLYVATAAQVPPLSFGYWLAGVGIALPLALLASALPAREAARVSPIAAIRGSESHQQTGVSASRLSLLRACLWPLLFMAAGGFAAMQPPWMGLPLWGHASSLCAIAAAAAFVPLALRGISTLMRPVLASLFGIEGRLAASQIRASTHRLSVSVAALTVALALTVAIAVMVGSFRQTVLYWVEQTMGADLYVRPGTPPRSQNPPTFSEATLKLLREHPAVLAFDGYRSMDLPYGDRVIKLGTGDFDVQLQHGRLAMKTPGDLATLLRGARDRGEVLISESFALRFGVKEGQKLTLPTPNGPHEFRIAAQFYDYSNDSGTISMNHREFQKWFGESRPTHVALYLKPGSDPETVRRELLQQLDGRGLVAIFTNAGLRGEVLRIFDATFAITWALEIIAVLVAMAGVAATMLTLVLERREEIRLLRIAGADAGQVRRTIVLESGLLGLVSQTLGLIVGLLLSLVLIHVINPQSFGWSIRFHAPWLFLIGSTILTVVGTMMAGFYPAWRVTRGLGLMVLILAALPSLHAAEPTWKPALPNYAYRFPEDHGQHPEQKIEWWYFTGNLDSGKDRRLGYQLTFFRIGVSPEVVQKSPWALRDVWMAHFAVSDVAEGRYHQADRLNRAGPGLAGAQPSRVWNEDWESVLLIPSADLGKTRFQLKAADAGFGIDLELVADSTPIIHGHEGISQKGTTAGNASHYYSFPRMLTQGEVRLAGEVLKVTGESWMDHEFGTSFLEKGTQGWDWFSAQLSDGSELMLFQLRGGHAASNAGTLIHADGRVTALTSADFTLAPGSTWTSVSKAVYPIEWTIHLPAHGLDLECRAAMPNQEFRASSTPGLGYWEGAVDYSGSSQGRPITGRGYLEMTGYSGQSMSVWFGGEPSK